jgi:hypothetical protein
MRKIEILADVKLRFPGRDAEFDVGIEVGAVSVLIAQGVPLIQRHLSRDATDQLRPIAEQFRYTMVVTETEEGQMNVSLSNRPRRPLLRVV